MQYREDDYEDEDDCIIDHWGNKLYGWDKREWIQDTRADEARQMQIDEELLGF